jgi:hypothetical protein
MSQNPQKLLSGVRYTSIRPDNKTTGYVAGDRAEFTMPPDVAYIDGKQSYLYLEVRNTSLFKNVVNGAEINIPAPVMFYPHVGVSGLFERMTLLDLNGKQLEDLEAQHMVRGILNSYTHDDDEYETMSKVEGVSHHCPVARNRLCGDPRNCVHYPPSYLGTNADDETVLLGNPQAATTQYCLPLPFGLFSAYAGEHQVYPNLDIGGSKINLYLETPERALTSMTQKFVSIDVENKYVVSYFQYNEGVPCDNIPIGNPLPVDPVDKLYISQAILNTSVDRFMANDTKNCLFRPGTSVYVSYTVVNGGAPDNRTLTTTIQEVAINTQADGNPGEQMRITLTDTIPMIGIDVNTNITNIRVRLSDITPNYEIDRIELRVLETIPSNQQEISQAVRKGINYMTYQLNKFSTPAQLKNQVLNIPSALTRALSIWDVPVVSGDMDTFDSNSLMWCQQEPLNTSEYQWQITDHLTPNRPVLVNKLSNTKNDNQIYYQQLQMAFKPVGQLRALGDALFGDDALTKVDTGLQRELALPFLYPILLAPVGQSYKLLDSEPQLRINHSSVLATGAKLHHVVVFHARTLVRNGDINEVEL